MSRSVRLAVPRTGSAGGISDACESANLSSTQRRNAHAFGPVKLLKIKERSHLGHSRRVQLRQLPATTAERWRQASPVLCMGLFSTFWMGRRGSLRPDGTGNNVQAG